MQRTVNRYGDPTGGGEDAYLVLPEWANAPDSILVSLPDGTRLEFEYDEAIDPDQMIEEAGL